MAILEVNNVKKIYTTRFGSNKVQALSDVSFSVEEGEYVAVMGESGSGKTTLLNIIAALDKPTDGEVYLNGRRFSDIKEAEIAKFNSNDLRSYRESQKDFWDMCAVTETAEKKGRAEGMAEGMEKGRAEGKAELIKTMHANGMTAETIAAAIGFDLAEVEEILNQQALS